MAIRSSAQASGPGVNPVLIIYWMGILFVVLGVIIGGGMIALGVASGDDDFVAPVVFGLFFMAIFSGIGGLFAVIGHRQLHGDDKVLSEGRSYYGKIFSYSNDSRITMNGQPCIVLNVRYLRNGQIAQSSVNTNEVNYASYPLGATVEIKVLENQAALVPGSVSDMKLEQENDLMNPDFDALGKASSLGVSCPNCGANIAVPIGMARYCPYCDTKVTLTADGRVIG